MNAAASATTGPSGPLSGRTSAAISPFGPGPKRTSTNWPGRNSVMPNRRSVSIWTKISGVPSPRVRKPKPRSRLNHFTCARSRPLVGRHGNMGPRRRHLRRMDRRRFIHAEDAERLQALGPRQHLADDARAFIGGLIAVAAQAGHVQQHVGHAVVGNDEAVTLGDIEPFDDAGDFDDRAPRPRR